MAIAGDWGRPVSAVGDSVAFSVFGLNLRLLGGLKDYFPHSF